MPKIQKKNKIEQWRLLQVGTGLEIELLNDSREVQRQDLGGTWPGAREILSQVLGGESPP